MGDEGEEVHPDERAGGESFEEPAEAGSVWDASSAVSEGVAGSLRFSSSNQLFITDTAFRSELRISPLV